MNYNTEFKKLIEDCEKNDQYIGLGNPNAKILFVGKEPGTNKSKEQVHGSAQSWIEKKIDYSASFIPKEKNQKNGNHTWQKYQKLYEMIFSDHIDTDKKIDEEKYKISFVENIFTTELSNLPALNTNNAKKAIDFETELCKRKKLFWHHNFIQQFPIILIFASDNKYIETYQGEVCKLFDVEFFEQRNCAKLDKYWIHYAKENKNKVYPKLLIHTRQLTNGASIELLKKIANEVKSFVKDNSLQIKVK